MSSFTIILLIFLAVAGVVMLTLGRGVRRENAHPHCRRCRYDLTGLALESPDARCPECGAGLGGKRAVRTGERRRRPWMLVTGISLLTIATGAGGVHGWRIATSLDWKVALKPEWLLEMDTSSTDPDVSYAATVELAKRAVEGRLGGKRLARLGEQGVDVYVRDNLNTMHEWGNFVELAWKQGYLDDASLVRYLETRFFVSVAPKYGIRPGDPIPFVIALHTRKGGENYADILVGLRLESVTVNGSPLSLLRDVDGPVGVMIKPGNRYESSYTYWVFEADPALEIGRHDVLAYCTIEIYRGSPGPLDSPVYVQQPAPPVAVLQKSRTSYLTLLSYEKEFLFAIEDDDESSAAMDEAVRVTRASIRETDDGVMLECSLTTMRLPVDISGYVYWRVADREWRLGPITSNARHWTPSCHELSVVVDEFDEDVVDIVIRPNPEPARLDYRISRYWGREIVIRDVPVTHESP
ncbi:MAG: hypothetical protein EA376_02385 [Phycisphaeraceae bacterium]|nr:MAG: hypothetical protein EA376_02385 [Phycisphaeraceae bacterium]